MAANDGAVKTLDADAIFRSFTACPDDPKTLIVDVRPRNRWEKGHIAGSYCIRKPSSGETLLDYSKADYDQRWSADVWWNRDVIVYGEAGLKKDHPVVAFLAADKHARSIGLFKEGLDAFQQRYPFLVTTSLRSGAAARRYPSQLDPLLYLGDWTHAEALERHSELGIKSVVTIHNNPDNLKLPASKYSHLKIELADIDVADIGAHLRSSFDFIEAAVARKQAVLVHCGAGVSRSATLCIAYLMRKHRWSAQKALDYCKSRRSLVAPNDGFWRTLCALEAQLGIAERSDVDAFSGYQGADAPPPAPIEEPRVRVTFVPAGASSAPAGSMSQTAAPPPVAPTAAGAAAAAVKGRDGKEEGRTRGGSERERRRSRSRSRSRSERDRRRRGGSRSRSRERRRDGGSREAAGRRSRSRSRDRRRGGGAPLAAPAASRQQQVQQEWIELEAAEGVVLEVLREGKQLGHLVLELQRVGQQCVFGRLPSCEVPVEHLSISRAHAQLTRDGGGNLSVTDLGSAHGTNVDGAWIKPKVPKQLRVGSVLSLGASVRQYKVVRVTQQPAAAAAQQ
ncbi:hypothetical protein D9Q98_004826 [Chlorella vulgaris]|uniref:protein-tyrosine-phosphatase n=1 Tax=Chlorella vulgaris TaxID=3077 RepID=A0A9D4YX05_CHLVU|nr:hypothetical protein D9Q98_004826 [Chlorella vulgaris]